MNELFLSITRFIRQFRLWFLVMPWEQAIRVRLGKHKTVLKTGWHWRLPFIDRVYVQNMRLRGDVMTPQTMSTADGKTLTVGLMVLFSIGDILKVYETMNQPEDVIQNLVSGCAAEYVRENHSTEITPKDLEASIIEQADLSSLGLIDIQVRVSDFAFVKTYRLIQGQRYSSAGVVNMARELGDDTK